MPSTSETMRLGVVVERRDMDNPWQRRSWHVVGVMPGAPELDAPRVLREGPGWAQYHAATLPVALHRRETEGYRYNLSNREPVVFVMLRFDEDEDTPLPALVTVCPYEAQDYLDAGDGEEIVESVPMPEAVMAWVRDYVETHHVDEPFEKRKRKQWKKQEPGFGRRPERARDKRHG